MLTNRANDNLPADITRAIDYLSTGGMGEVVGITDAAYRAKQPRIQSTPDLVLALCILAQETLAARGTAGEMREALEISDQALCDWLTLYAPDMSDETRVASARKRVHEKGTIAYVADVLKVVRRALSTIKDQNNGG